MSADTSFLHVRAPLLAVVSTGDLITNDFLGFLFLKKNLSQFFKRINVALLFQFIALLNTDTTPVNPVEKLVQLCNTEESLQAQLLGRRVAMEYSTTQVADDSPLLPIGTLVRKEAPKDDEQEK